MIDVELTKVDCGLIRNALRQNAETVFENYQIDKNKNKKTKSAIQSRKVYKRLKELVKFFDEAHKRA